MGRNMIGINFLESGQFFWDCNKEYGISDYRKIIAIDDYGRAVYRCHYSSKMIFLPEGIISGGVMPGIKVKYLCHPDHKATKKQSQIAFNDMDENCNTCKNLQRIKHAKNDQGFLFGECKKQDNKPIKFHPDDWMGMLCYENREN